MEFTVIGNTMNVASRIEALNKTLGTSLLISKTTRDALQNPPRLSALSPQQVKGVSELFDVREGGPALWKILSDAREADNRAKNE